MTVIPIINVYKLKQSYTDKYCIKYDTSGTHGLAMNPCLEFADRIFTANTVIYSYNPDESKGYVVDATTNGKIPLNVLELVAKNVKSSDLKNYLKNVPFYLDIKPEDLITPKPIKFYYPYLLPNTNLTCEQKYMTMAKPAVVQTPEYWKRYEKDYIDRCKCEKEAESFMARARFPAGTDLAKEKESMIESCIKRKSPTGTTPKQGTEQKSNIDTQTIAIVLGVVVVAYFLTK